MRSLVGVVLIGLASACSEKKESVIGKWSAEKTSLLTLYFYSDQSASLSSTGFFNLRWQMENDTLVRIDALDKKMHFNFRIQKDAKGAFGVLELAGFDTLAFRKI